MGGGVVAVVAAHPRSVVVASRVLQGVSSFGFAAAAAGGFTAAAVTLTVGGVLSLVGAAFAGSLRTLPGLLREGTVWGAAMTGAVAMVLAAQAYETAGVATVAFLLLLVPLFASLMAPFYGEKLGRRDLLGLAIALVGIACFAQPSVGFESEWVGIVLALLAGLALGVLWHQSRSLAKRGHEPWAATAAQMVVPGVLGLGVVLAFGARPAGAALAWLVVSGVGYMGNSVLRLVGLRSISASQAALIAPVSALTSTTLAFVLLGQVPDALTVVGAVVVIAGLLVAQWPTGRSSGS